MSLIEQLILWLLGLNTLRGILIDLGLIPRRGRYSWLFYNRRDYEFLRELVEKHPDIPQKMLTQNQVKVNLPIMALFQLMSQYIHQFEAPVSYGKVTPTLTRFYINTMEASHNENSLRSMSELIQTLVSKN